MDAWNSTKVGELGYDLQTALGRMDAPEFDTLRNIGMAACLSIHIKGLGEIPYDVFRKVSDYYFNIPSYALKPILQLLEELEIVRLVSDRSKISAVIPNVPRFESIYDIVGTYALEAGMNEHEQAMLYILSSIAAQPEKKDRLLNSSGMERPVLERCLKIGETSSLTREHRSRGKSIIASPFYFADNLDSLADIAAKTGSGDISRVIGAIRGNQGWPLSLIGARSEIGGTSLSPVQMELLQTLAAEGIIKPPTIRYSGREENFLFTPKPGNARLNASNREIYERAMALVSAVRKGQLLPDVIRIRSPLRILEALRDRGYLRSNSDANVQYQNLVVMRVGMLKRVSAARSEFHLLQTVENVQAVNVAISLLSSGELAGMEVSQEARLALSKDETYIQSVIAAVDLRKRENTTISAEAREQFEQLVFTF